MFKRIAILTYGIASYAIFFATFLYAIGFIGNFGAPRTMDGEPLVGLGNALLINIALLGVFALQHSIMARPAFKRWFTRFVPKPMERSTYVLASSLLLVGLFVLWQPMGGIVWSVSDPIGQAALYGAYAFGWLLVLIATFLINHFDLFGLRQVWLYFRGKPYTALKFGTPWLYGYVRHPLYVGWLFVFWSTPVMTVAHLVFALATTAYILIAVQFEERDLIKEHGRSYIDYRRRVPMLIPGLRRSREQAQLA